MQKAKEPAAKSDQEAPLLNGGADSSGKTQGSKE
jgi:hypothetical protein